MTLMKLGVTRVVLARTRAGEREAIAVTSVLDDVERRLLLLANGYTPLDDWAARFRPEDDLHAAVEHLLRLGLLRREVVQPDACLDACLDA